MPAHPTARNGFGGPEVALRRPKTWDLPRPVEHDLSIFHEVDPEKIQLLDTKIELLDRVTSGDMGRVNSLKIMSGRLELPLTYLTYLAYSAHLLKPRPELQVPKIELAKHDLAIWALWAIANGFDHDEASRALGEHIGDFPRYLDEATLLLGEQVGSKLAIIVRKACQNGTIPLINGEYQESLAGKART